MRRGRWLILLLAVALLLAACGSPIELKGRITENAGNNVIKIDRNIDVGEENHVADEITLNGDLIPRFNEVQPGEVAVFRCLTLDMNPGQARKFDACNMIQKIK